MPDRDYIDIGIVNNMPDAALQATERQLLSLIAAAEAGIPVRVHFYTLPGVARSDSTRRRMSRYKSIDDLWDRPLDGMIVTGTEPRAEDLRQERYWDAMTRLVDWAESNTTSTIWSCLAAHAAVLYLDEIHRCRLAEKCVGLYDCKIVSRHTLTAGAPASLQMPHSRWNDLNERYLSGAGYSILTRSAGGVDIFLKERQSLFLFFQGHPEYDAQTLLLEYRRDVRKFLAGETSIYPSLPYAYFDTDASAALTAFGKRAMARRAEASMHDFPAVSPPRNTWRPAAVFIYRNWFAHLAGQSERRRPALLHQK